MPKILQAQKKNDVQLAKKRKFRVLAGKHHESKEVGRTEGGQPILQTMTYTAGEIVEATVDLVKLHGDTKYGYAGKNDVSKPIETANNDDGEEDVLDEMSVEDLRATAEAEEIDLSGATTKTEIISRIRSAQG